MNEVYILTIVKEIEDAHPEVRVEAYGNMETALNAYSVAVDYAREEAFDYEFPHEDSEIATETYRFFRIKDLHSIDAITITVESKEIIGEEPDDI